MYERVYCWLLIVLGVAGGACATYKACRSVRMHRGGVCATYNACRSVRMLGKGGRKGPAPPITPAGQCACSVRGGRGLRHYYACRSARGVGFDSVIYIGKLSVNL